MTGSKQPPLHAIALNIFTLCLSHQIYLELEWISRGEMNRLICDFDKWLNPLMFAELDYEWGLHTINGFADMHNVQLDCFNSRLGQWQWMPSLVIGVGKFIGCAPTMPY